MFGNQRTVPVPSNPWAPLDTLTRPLVWPMSPTAPTLTAPSWAVSTTWSDPVALAAPTAVAMTWLADRPANPFGGVVGDESTTPSPTQHARSATESQVVTTRRRWAPWSSRGSGGGGAADRRCPGYHRPSAASHHP